MAIAQNHVLDFIAIVRYLFGMPIIKSISKLRNKPRDGDLAVMSLSHYERLQAQADLFEKLGVAQAQSVAGAKGISHNELIKRLKRIGAK